MDQTHTIMPGSISGTHLVECPQCHASNGITAVRCWNCDRALPPELQAVSPSDLASESAWPKDAFSGVNLSGAAPREDTAQVAANTSAFDANHPIPDLPQTSRSERRARLAASTGADPSMALPSDLFAGAAAPAGPIAVGKALSEAGMASGTDDRSVPFQASTLDEQARAAIPDWKPEPWKPSEPAADEAAGAEPAPSSASSPAGAANAAGTSPPDTARPVEFFPQFQPVRPPRGAAPASSNEASSVPIRPGDARGADVHSPSAAASAPAAAAGSPSPASTSPVGAAAPVAGADDRLRPFSTGRPPLSPRTQEPRDAGGRPRRMTPEEIAATFRAPIRSHPWQDPRWLGAGAAALALIIGLGVFFYPRTVDESDWTPASTRGLVEQRGSVRDPQAILDGEPVGTSVVRPARDPQAILNGEPTSAGADAVMTPEADTARTPAAGTGSSRAAASAAIDALLATPSARSGSARPAAAPTTAAMPSPAAPAPTAPAVTAPVLSDTTSTSTTGCAPNVLALGLCPTR